MGLSVLCLHVGQSDKSQTRVAVPGKMVAIIMLLVLALLAETSDAISDFGSNSLSIRSNEEFFRGKVKIVGSKPPRVRYTVRLHLPGIKMSQHLKDRSSPQYTRLSRNLSKNIQRLFANTAGKQTVSNIRFSKFTEQHKEHGSLNKAGSKQKGLHSTTSFPSPESLSFLTSTFAMTTQRPTRWSRRAFPFSRSTFATTTRERRRGPVNERTSTAKSVSAHRDYTTVSTDSTTVPPTAVTATSVQTTTLERTSPTGKEKVFDTEYITRLFKDCYPRAPNGEYVIFLEKYLDAYTELLSIFNLLGSVFSFVGDAIREKLTQLRQLRQRDIERSQNNYTTFQSMFEYEHSPQGSSAEHEGVSTNIWLHRGLKYFSQLIKVSLAASSDKSLSDHAQEQYTAILAPYHSWYVQTVAYLALLSLPTRSHLMELMGIPENAEGLQALVDLSSAMEAVYDDVELLYVKYSS